MTYAETIKAAKERHPGMVLLFTVGDFYEAYGEDATTLGSRLGLTVTNRKCELLTATMPEGQLMAGFPHHQLEVYLQKLLQSGHRVAICEAVDEVPKGKPVERVAV